MLLFGHLGITLGAALAVQGVKQYSGTNSEKKITQLSPTEIDDKLSNPRKRFSLVSVTETLAKNIDIRFLLAGAILPDIIDKPLGIFHIGNGRSISHTLLFLFIFTVTGLLLYILRKWKRILILAAGIFFHLILDSMWLNPHTLFWPFNGLQLSAGNPSAWFSYWGSELTGDPLIYLGEAIGFLIIVYFIYFLFKQKKFVSFLKYGYL